MCGADFQVCDSEIEQIRELHDERALERHAAPRIPAFVVDDVQVAERPVDDVEPRVRAELARRRVVLKKTVETGRSNNDVSSKNGKICNTKE